MRVQLIRVRDAILIDAYEHCTLGAFETFFNVTVWFACFPPGELHTGYLFRNASLAGLAPMTAQGKETIAVPLRLTKPVDERRDFMAAVMGAISLR